MRLTTKPFISGIIGLGLAATAARADQSAWPTLVHPGMTVQSINLGATYSTMGLDWLSNGDMVLATCGHNYGGGSVPGTNASAAVYLVSGITGTPTVRKIADMFRQPSGVVVVGDTIYVSDREAFYRINSLNPANTASNKTKVIDYPVENLDPDNGWNNGYWHQWIFCPMYYNGRFYAPYSGTIVGGGWSERDPSSSYAGAFLSWAKNGAGGLQKFAGGLRSPNGAGIGPGGMMLVSDNQGSWLPSCPLMLMKQNKFYGHRQNSPFKPNWAQAANDAGTLPYEPPVAWMLDGDAQGLSGGGIGQSTAQPVYMDHGPYVGDWIVGDANEAGIARVSLDPVNGGTGTSANYNGAVHFFTGGIVNGGTTPNPNRLSLHPTQNILYVGTLGPIGNWPSDNQPQPFYRINMDNAAIANSFEALKVYSRSNGVEIVFSKPVDSSTAVRGSFSLGAWHVNRTKDYGSSTDQITAPTISSTQLSCDNKRIFLQIGNQAASDRILRITMTGVKSSGGSLIFNNVYFTHNWQSTAAFNACPSEISERPKVDASLQNRVSQVLLRPGLLQVKANLNGAYTVSLRSFNGAQAAEEKTGHAPAEFTFQPGGKGIYILEVRQAGRSFVRPVMF